MEMYRHDGGFELCSRGNFYRRPDGEQVRITAVYRGDLKKALRSYMWRDKEYLGRVASHDRCIWHDCDPRATGKPFIPRQITLNDGRTIVWKNWIIPQ